jgi:DNA-binding LacI/PurR family transcriptional regulator
MEGYEAALEQAGCRLDTLLVAGQYLRTRGYAAMSDYLDATSAGERVDALFCENDILAIGALQALRERDLTMGIVGFDNIDEAAAPEWQLTTYDQRRERLVEEALNRLIDVTEGLSATAHRGTHRAPVPSPPGLKFAGDVLRHAAAKLQSPLWLLITEIIRSSPLSPQCSWSSACRVA